MKKRITLLVIIMSVLICGCKKKEQTVEREYEYESYDQNEIGQFEDTIVIDGKTYQLVDLNDVTLQITGEREVVEKEEIIYLADLSELEEEKEYEFNGEKHVLHIVRKEWVRQEIEIERQAVVSYPAVTGKLREQDVDSTVAIVVWDDGKQVEKDAQLTEIRAVSEAAWINDFSISGQFYGDEHTRYFKTLSGEEISVDSSKPSWSGYRKDILKDRNLSEQYYRILDCRWTDQYHKSGNQYVRNAIYTGQRYARDYEAVYTLRYRTYGYVLKVVYQADGKDIDTDSKKKIYKIKAIVRYKLIKNR